MRDRNLETFPRKIPAPDTFLSRFPSARGSSCCCRGIWGGFNARPALGSVRRFCCRGCKLVWSQERWFWISVLAYHQAHEHNCHPQLVWQRCWTRIRSLFTRFGSFLLRRVIPAPFCYRRLRKPTPTMKKLSPRPSAVHSEHFLLTETVFVCVGECKSVCSLWVKWWRQRNVNLQPMFLAFATDTGIMYTSDTVLIYFYSADVQIGTRDTIGLKPSIRRCANEHKMTAIWIYFTINGANQSKADCKLWSVEISRLQHHVLIKKNLQHKTTNDSDAMKTKTKRFSDVKP